MWHTQFDGTLNMIYHVLISLVDLLTQFLFNRSSVAIVILYAHVLGPKLNPH